MLGADVNTKSFFHRRFEAADATVILDDETLTWAPSAASRSMVRRSMATLKTARRCANVPSTTTANAGKGRVVDLMVGCSLTAVASSSASAA